MKLALRNLLFVIACLATAGWAFVMLSIPGQRDAIFLDHEVHSWMEWGIVLGILLVFCLNILALIWQARQARSPRDNSFSPALLAFNLLCLLLMASDKVLIDDMAREYRLGLETAGEMIILYGCMSVQMLFNLILLFRLSRISR